MKNIIILAVLIVVVGSVIFYTGFENRVFGEVDSSGCTVSLSTKVTIGDDVSTQVLPITGNRAWAVIQQPANATNTVAVSFDAGEAAVLGQGYQLHDYATSTGNTDKVTFGRNVELPYTGAVTAITNNGTTTVLVTECIY
jgi:hypothetical protein